MSRSPKYLLSIEQITSLIQVEEDLIANLANVCAVIKENLGFFWIGFYLVKNEQLVLGPFQGPVACTKIDFGRGVCGKSWETKKSILVKDVHQFPDHIACSSVSKSEVVIPMMRSNGDVWGVLDIDSEFIDDFTIEDVGFIEQIEAIISSKHG